MRPDDLALLLWLRYDVRCEAFDRTLPGAPSRRDPDCWVPFDRAAMLQRARIERSALNEEARRLGVAGERLQAAREASDRWSMSRKAEVLASLERGAQASRAAIPEQKGER